MPTNPACTSHPPIIDGATTGTLRYALTGPQVEPGAAYWTAGACAVPCVVRISELLPFTDNPKNKDFYIEPYPSDPPTVAAEIKELKQLAADRDKPLPVGTISQFLQLRPQPLGAVFCLGSEQKPREQKPLKTLDEQCSFTAQDEPAVIQSGRELARWFEAETPGLGHRHALNCLVFSCDLSPLRQARIWMALDVAIHSALLAAWHYKWASDRPCTVYRPRPWEVDNSVSVLYDKCVNQTGCADDGDDPFPMPSPGTPRHPAYPSGHSTVGGAGSEILSYFFPKERKELDKLADNAGMARLWAGIHYRSDHVQGLKLGRSVAQLVISQLEADGVPLPTKPPAQTPANAAKPAPSKEDVRTKAYEERSRCLNPASPENKRDCFEPLDRGCTDGDSGPGNRSVQQGAR